MRHIILLGMLFLLATFATVVMSYISMATPIGPWIAPTLVLITILLLKLFAQKKYATEQVVLLTAAGSVGGIVATGVGFSFPTLYFLDASLFHVWLENPVYFATVLAGLTFTAGWLGIWIANIMQDTLIVQQQRAFPIGQLVYKMIGAHNQMRKAVDLVIGFVGTFLFCIAQDGLYLFKGFIPKYISLIGPCTIGFMRIPLIRFDIWPMLWAIGFVTGHVIAIPLLVGAITKLCIADSLHYFFFHALSAMDFMLAFCSGIILASTVMGLCAMPHSMYSTVRGFLQKRQVFMIPAFGAYVYEGVAVCGVTMLFFSYFHFPFIAQWYVLLFTGICTYQIIEIAADIGLAPLGRFATFVMVPAMFLFRLNYTQLVCIATFVEVAGGVAADILFGRKMAYLAACDMQKIKRYQYLGLIASSCVIGIIMWLFITRFGLGSDALFAYKAQGRQLLIHAQHFNYYVLGLGFLFGNFLKYTKLNPMLVLGGLLMPLNISCGLIVGGLATYAVREKEEWFPFWSGVFAANSLWMLVQTFL
jgi:hypothetical protein